MDVDSPALEDKTAGRAAALLVNCPSDFDTSLAKRRHECRRDGECDGKLSESEARHRFVKGRAGG